MPESLPWFPHEPSNLIIIASRAASKKCLNHHPELINCKAVLSMRNVDRQLRAPFGHRLAAPDFLKANKAHTVPRLAKVGRERLYEAQSRMVIAPS